MRQRLRQPYLSSSAVLARAALKKIPADGLPRRPAIESGLITVSATAIPLQLRGGMWLDRIGMRATKPHSISPRL
jgi:hypothetical protein